MKLVRRLTFHLLLVIGVVFAVDAYLGIEDQLSRFDEDIRRDHRVIGQAFRGTAEGAWRASGEAGVLELLREANAHTEGVRMELVFLDAAEDGSRIPAASARQVGALPRDGRPVQIRDDRDAAPRLLTYVPLQIPGRPGAALEIAEQLGHERVYAAAHLRRTLVTAAVAFSACGLVAWLVGVRVVGRPIAALVAKARRIGGGDFSAPLELSRHDELSLLAGEMNATAERLDAATRWLAAESAARIAALEQLRHADRLTTVGKLASGLAHELGTPLNVVSGRATMIASGETKDPEEAVACARIVCQQAERMTAIVRQLLDFARRRDVEKVATDVAQLARQTTSLLEPMASGRGVQLVDVGEGVEPRLVAQLDPSQMQQALTNLVVNGIQATRPRGSVRVRALRQEIDAGEVEGRSAGGYAVLEVSDDGEGISADCLSVIFDPFFTTKRVGEGTGLGLSVTYGIVEEHGGWIDVQSTPGRGSRFRIWIPAEAA